MVKRETKRRKALRIPWGYDVDPVDKQLLHPNDFELDALEQAFEYIRLGATYDATSKWLSEYTGRYISPNTMSKKAKERSKEINSERGKERIKSVLDLDDKEERTES